MYVLSELLKLYLGHLSSHPIELKGENGKRASHSVIEGSFYAGYSIMYFIVLKREAPIRGYSA